METKQKVFSLNELLLRRKELAKMVVSRNELLRHAVLFTDNLRRTLIRSDGESLDQVSGTLPKLNKGQVEEEVNFYSHKLREVDEVIQQKNFSVDVTGPASLFADYTTNEEKLEKKAEGTITKKLAAFLTRRKSLNTVCKGNLGPSADDLLNHIDERLPSIEGVDQIKSKADKMTAGEAVAKADFYHRQLRLVDKVIHDANNSTTIEADASLMDDYE